MRFWRRQKANLFLGNQVVSYFARFYSLFYLYADVNLKASMQRRFCRFHGFWFDLFGKIRIFGSVWPSVLFADFVSSRIQQQCEFLRINCPVYPSSTIMVVHPVRWKKSSGVIHCLAGLCVDCINTVNRNNFWRRRPYRKQAGQSNLLWSKCLEDNPVFIPLTSVAAIKYRHWFNVIQRQFSLRIALDLFDTVEMLEVVLEENTIHHNISRKLEVLLEETILHHNIPRSFECAIIAFACISFILSPLQLMQVKTGDYGEWKYRKLTSFAQRTLQTLCELCFSRSAFGTVPRIWQRCVYLHRQKRYNNSPESVWDLFDFWVLRVWREILDIWRRHF